MKVNLLTELTTLDGKPIPEGTKGKVMTLRSVFCNALLLQQEGQAITGEEKANRYNFALLIHNAEQINLDVNQAKQLQDLVAVGYIPLIVGQVWNILNPPQEILPEAEEAPVEAPNGVAVEDGKI